jgi:hypothetical protein
MCKYHVSHQTITVHHATCSYFPAIIPLPVLHEINILSRTTLYTKHNSITMKNEVRVLVILNFTTLETYISLLILVMGLCHVCSTVRMSGKRENQYGGYKWSMKPQALDIHSIWYLPPSLFWILHCLKCLYEVEHFEFR